MAQTDQRTRFGQISEQSFGTTLLSWGHGSLHQAGLPRRVKEQLAAQTLNEVWPLAWLVDEPICIVGIRWVIVWTTRALVNTKVVHESIGKARVEH